MTTYSFADLARMRGMIQRARRPIGMQFGISIGGAMDAFVLAAQSAQRTEANTFVVMCEAELQTYVLAGLTPDDLERALSDKDPQS